MSEEDGELHICESCGQTTPVDGKVCPNCGGILVALHEDKKVSGDEIGDDELSETGSTDPDAGTQSLEALADSELEEDEQAYRKNAYGDSDE